MADKVAWISPMVIVPKKNGKIRVFVDYKKLNDATIPNPFPLTFKYLLQDDVARCVESSEDGSKE